MLESVLQCSPLSNEFHNVFLESSNTSLTLSFFLSTNVFQKLYMLLSLGIFEKVYVYRQELTHMDINCFSYDFKVKIYSM
jgi:hypothetical protein